jgi:hypothetical protein
VPIAAIRVRNIHRLHTRPVATFDERLVPEKGSSQFRIIVGLRELSVNNGPNVVSDKLDLSQHSMTYGKITPEAISKSPSFLLK